MFKNFKSIYFLFAVGMPLGVINLYGETPALYDEAPALFNELSLAEPSRIAPVISSDGKPCVKFNFNNASLRNLKDQIEDIFDIKFLSDDALQGPGIDSRSLDESKITFKTYRPMTKREAWNTFNSFLRTANWAIVPTADQRIFRITSLAKANKQPVPTYINCSLEFLPENDQVIRYVYQLTNATAEQMKNFLDKLKSPAGTIDIYSDLKAIIITDSAYNIKTLMTIVLELDKSAVSQVFSFLRLQEADAQEVADIIAVLQKQDAPAQRPAATSKKNPTVYAIPGDVKVIPVPRQQALILLGSKTGVARIENFIREHIDTSLKLFYLPVHVVDLNFAPAKDVADILNNVLKYGSQTSVGKAGGVLGGEKYFANVQVTPEPTGNRLLIRASKQDFEHIKKMIKELDIKQGQVAIEALILTIKISDIRKLGVQWRNKTNGNVNVQLSGIQNTGILTGPADVGNGKTDSNIQSLATNLISLVTSLSAGSVVATLGKTSVWAIFAALQTMTETKIISNPFLVVTNKYTGAVAVGSRRRVLVSQTTDAGSSADNPGNQFDSMDAALKMQITPQINKLGIINLDINIELSDFTSLPSSATDLSAGNKDTRVVKTNANVADGEVLAISGLIRKTQVNGQRGAPILKDIPLIRWFFSSENKESTDEMLMIFISAKIMGKVEEDFKYTQKKSGYAREVIKTAKDMIGDERDPIYRWFFKPADLSAEKTVDEFMPEQPLTYTAPRNEITNQIA